MQQMLRAQVHRWEPSGLRGMVARRQGPRSRGRHGDKGLEPGDRAKGDSGSPGYQFCLPCVADIQDASNVAFHKA